MTRTDAGTVDAVEVCTFRELRSAGHPDAALSWLEQPAAVDGEARRSSS